MMTN